MKITVINGANMDILEKRDAIYGRISLKELETSIADYAQSRKINVEFFQSNCEGCIIDKIHECYDEDGLIINPGAYSHYSYAIADALEALSVPKVEVHLTDIMAREDFRHVSVTGKNCDKIISGLGVDGYFRAIDYISECIQHA